MDTSVQDIKPRSPRPPKLDTAERIVKLILQCTTIASFIAGAMFITADYGGKFFRYVSIAYEAVRVARSAKDTASSEEGGAKDDVINLTYVYTVRKNDQLLDLCLHHNMTLNQLLDLNTHIADPNDIQANRTRLRLRAQCYHLVKPGDQLKVVAAKYCVTVKELMRANHKLRNHAMRGETLIIPYHVRP